MRSLVPVILAALLVVVIAATHADAQEPTGRRAVCTLWALSGGTPEKNREALERAINDHLAAGRTIFHGGYTPVGHSISCAW